MTSSSTCSTTCPNTSLGRTLVRVASYLLFSARIILSSISEERWYSSRCPRWSYVTQSSRLQLVGKRPSRALRGWTCGRRRTRFSRIPEQSWLTGRFHSISSILAGDSPKATRICELLVTSWDIRAETSIIIQNSTPGLTV